LLDLLRSILKGSCLSEYIVILIIVTSLLILLFSLLIELLLSLSLLFNGLMSHIDIVLKVPNSDIGATWLELRSISLKLGLLVTTIIRLHLVLKRLLLLRWHDHILLPSLLFFWHCRIHLLLVHVVILLLHLLKILEKIRLLLLLLPLACLHTLGIRLLLLDCPLVSLGLGRRYHELLKFIF
jgi:hypothetical protein